MDGKSGRRFVRVVVGMGGPCHVTSMRMSVLLMSLTLGACSSGADRAAYLNQLVGQPETTLVRQMGVPTRVFETGGRRFLAYEEQHVSAVFGGFGGFGGGFGGYGVGYGGFGLGGLPAEVVQYRCETTFEVGGERVLNWMLRGNACT